MNGYMQVTFGCDVLPVMWKRACGLDERLTRHAKHSQASIIIYAPTQKYTYSRMSKNPPLRLPWP